MGPGSRPGRRQRRYARVPVNGKLPIGPMPISPEMLSPETLPENASVSGIGLVIETFQATSSPLVVPSKISVELPSAPCVPVSVPPALVTDSVALRSPIGVVITRFQFPSTAISVSPIFPGKPERFRAPSSDGGITYLAAQAYGGPKCGDQARAAARIRFVIRMRNATYWIAKAASLAPTRTTVT